MRVVPFDVCSVVRTRARTAHYCLRAVETRGGCGRPLSALPAPTVIMNEGCFLIYRRVMIDTYNRSFNA